MSAWTPGHIEIGGRIKRSQLKELCRIANDSGARLDWASTDDLEVDDVVSGEVLALMSDSACYGTFPELEEWCDQLGLSFIRRSDPSDDAGGYIEWHVGDDRHSMDADSGGAPMVPQGLISEGCKALREGRMYDALWVLSGVIREVPVLPPLVIDEPEKKAKKKWRRPKTTSARGSITVRR